MWTELAKVNSFCGDLRAFFSPHAPRLPVSRFFGRFRGRRVLRREHGCCWEGFQNFAYCGLVGNPHLTAIIFLLPSNVNQERVAGSFGRKERSRKARNHVLRQVGYLNSVRHALPQSPILRPEQSSYGVLTYTQRTKNVSSLFPLWPLNI